ncbi:MAG: hypothetical protein FWH42_06205 [Dehalococcoidia bacterium]|nr:hypothetical protein [Dehalococcoidia bacterium]
MLRKMKNAILSFAIAISIVTVLVISVAGWGGYSLIIALSDSNYQNDANEFISGNYLTYAGSDVVVGFFPQHNELSDYSEIEFHYFDGRKKSTIFHLYYITYVLDIRYNNEYIYQQNKNGELSKYPNTVGEYRNDFFVLYADSCAKDKKWCLAFNDDMYIIRYIAFYGKDVGTGNISGLIAWNTSLKWSSFQYEGP